MGRRRFPIQKPAEKLMSNQTRFFSAPGTRFQLVAQCNPMVSRELSLKLYGIRKSAPQ